MVEPTLNRPCGGRYANLLEAVGNTPLVELPTLSPKHPCVRVFAKLEGLEVPATARDKQFVITVANAYSDDVVVWARGASDFPSGVTMYDALDLPPVEEDPEEEL